MLDMFQVTAAVIETNKIIESPGQKCHFSMFSLWMNSLVKPGCLQHTKLGLCELRVAFWLKWCPLLGPTVCCCAMSFMLKTLQTTSGLQAASAVPLLFHQPWGHMQYVQVSSSQHCIVKENHHCSFIVVLFSFFLH